MIKKTKGVSHEEGNEVMGKKYLELIKNLGLFFIAGFLPNAMAFFMIPLYTRYLSTQEYGIADLFTNTIQLLIPVFTIQIHEAVLRFMLEKDCDGKEVISIGMKLLYRGMCLLVILTMFLRLTGILQLNWIYLIFFWLLYAGCAIQNTFSAWCRGANKVKVQTLASVLQMVAIVSSNLLFLMVFHFGIYGYLLANILGLAVYLLCIIAGTDISRNLHWKISDRQLQKSMILFCLPMILSSLSWWVNNASDKYILTFFKGVSVVGMYAVAYKIPTILKVFSDVVYMAFSISAIKEFDREDSDGFMGKSYSMISFFMCIVCSVLILCNLWIARILFAGEFYEAWHFVPPLLLSVLMNQLSLTCENILVGAKETGMISKTAVLGAVVNTMLNFLLIPFFGAYGAAIATAVGFLVFWLLRYLHLKKIVRLKNNFQKECFSYVLLFIQMIIAWWGNRFWYMQLLVLCMILFLYRKEILECLYKCRPERQK